MRRASLTLLTMLVVTPLAVGGTAERFRFPAEGLVMDKAQSLVWMRCSLGQTFRE